MGKKVKLAIVSYLNTLPFIHGLDLQKDHNFDIIYARPSECANLYFHDQCDIALIPVGALPYIEDYNLITNYCIGSTEAVRTVCVFSHDTIPNINKVYLDTDSRTSVLLTKILFKEHWKKKTIVYDELTQDKISDLHTGEAFLAIGDKVFELEEKYTYKYDLGEQWYKFSGLPFAFAVFVAKPDLEDGVSQTLNNILQKGIEAIPHLDLSPYSHIKDLGSYYTKNISYQFDKQKWIAMKQYFEYIRYVDAISGS